MDIAYQRGPNALDLPENMITMMMGREEGGVRTMSPLELKTGDHVRIVEGVMAGYEAIFQARTGKERVLLLLKLAQDRTARIQVSGHDIEPVVLNWSWPGQGRKG